MADEPSLADREWLELELGALLARVGSDRFVRGPILEPSGRYFPDRFVGGPAGVRTVARRLLTWADLADIDVRVVDESPAEDPRRIRIWEIEIAEVRPGSVTLLLLARGEAEQLPGALTPLLGVAARAHLELDRQLNVTYRVPMTSNERAREEELGGIATIELGWGLLALNAAERHHSAAGETLGGWQRLETATEAHGVLPMPALAYLLAVQLVVRGEGEDKRLLGLLLPNQAALVRRWVRTLGRDRAGLIARLPIAAPETWPDPSEVAPEPFAEADRGGPRQAEEREVKAGAAAVSADNRGRPVFRVPVRRAARWSLAGGALGALLIIPLSLFGYASSLGFVTVAALGAVAGRLLAPKRPWYRCSDPSCPARILKEHARCPGCGGVIAGRIQSPSLRLEAEEALGPGWYRDHGLPPPGHLEDDDEGGDARG